MELNYRRPGWNLSEAIKEKTEKLRIFSLNLATSKLPTSPAPIR